MPSHSRIPSDINSKKLIKALKKLGFVANTTGGDGSHIKLVWPKNEKIIVIPYKIYKQNAKHYIEAAEDVSGIDWNVIRKNL